MLKGCQHGTPPVQNNMHNDKKLIELKNLGAASVNILNTVGIRTYGDLANIGSAQAYRKIRQRGIHVSRALLYAMEGALLDQHWKTIDPALKAHLVQLAETIENPGDDDVSLHDDIF